MVSFQMHSRTQRLMIRLYHRLTNDDSDHEIKDQNVPLSALLMENGMVIPIGIGILVALALTATIVLIVRSKSKAASATGDETKADIESDDKN